MIVIVVWVNWRRSILLHAARSTRSTTSNNQVWPGATRTTPKFLSARPILQHRGKACILHAVPLCVEYLSRRARTGKSLRQHRVSLFFLVYKLTIFLSSVSLIRKAFSWKLNDSNLHTDIYIYIYIVYNLQYTFAKVSAAQCCRFTRCIRYLQNAELSVTDNSLQL